MRGRKQKGLEMLKDFLEGAGSFVKFFFVGYGVLFLLAGGCSSKDGPGPKPLPDVRYTDACDDAEERLKELGCKDDRGDLLWVNRKGEEFSETCRIAQEVGRIYMNTECVVESKDCEEVEECTQM